MSYGAKESFSLQASLCWAAFVSCFFTLYHIQLSLLMTGGTIPVSRYSYFDIGWPQTVGDRSTCVVQFRIQFGSMWRSSPNWVCVFSCGVRHVNAVVLIVLVLQPHLEFDNFFRKLFRVATFIFV